MAGMIEPRRLIVTNQFQRYHVSWDAIRNLDHSPSLFQADFAIEGKRLCRPPTVFRQSRQAKAAMLEALGCLSVIGKTSHLPCCPRSRIVGRAHAARPEISIELQPLRRMLIAGRKVSFACPNIPPTRQPKLSCAGRLRPSQGSPAPRARSSAGAHALRDRFSRSTPASITAISASI